MQQHRITFASFLTFTPKKNHSEIISIHCLLLEVRILLIMLNWTRVVLERMDEIGAMEATGKELLS